MEELEEDSVYFILKSGLSSRMSIDRAQNVHHGEDNDKRSEAFNKKLFITSLYSFWSQVAPDVRSELLQSWAYGHDFHLFGYSSQEYFASIGV